MRKIVKFSLILMFLICLNSQSNAMYTYENQFDIFKLTRNTIKPKYVTTYSKNSWTKEDVTVTIKSDKVLEILSGDFVLDDSKQILTKKLSENKKDIIKIRDKDGNIDEITYEVSWIDKVAPQIKGAENGKTYNSNLNLHYLDNGEIADIFVDKYDNSFEVFVRDTFVEDGNRRFVPFTKNSITAWVEKHYKGIEKYNYYLDGKLYATTSNTKYTFTGLQELVMNHEVKVEALNRYGKVIDSRSYPIKTGAFSDVILNQTEYVESIKVTGISNRITKVGCYIWIDGSYDTTLSYRELPITNGQVSCSFDIRNYNNRREKYKVHFYFHYKEGNEDKVLIYGGNIFMSNPYFAPVKNPNINEFIVDGKYYIRVTDKAGNESTVDFTLAK